MSRSVIPLDRLVLRPFHIWADRWFLLTAGNYSRGEFNTMTVSWGSLGTLWNKPFAQVVVRPSRYTMEFLERSADFTLSSFSEEYQDALRLLGTKSGRDGDKISEAGLTPIASSKAVSPCFAEANLVLECRKLYWQDLDSGHFLDPMIEEHYPRKDYHRVYYGEIVAVTGESRYWK